MGTLIIASVVFTLTYVLISAGRIPRLHIGRGSAALVGGVLMVILGILPLTDVMEYVDLDVIFLLLGMMMLVAGLEYTGMFSILSERLLKGDVTGKGLLARIMIVSAFLSAIALNDAVVLMLTPVVIRCCRRIGTNPIPHLIGLMLSANIGSLATPVGNPQNALIVSQTGMTFIDFSMHTLPISLICLPVAFVVIWAFFRKGLGFSAANDVTPCPDVCIDRPRLMVMTIITISCFILFVMSGYIGIGIHIIAMAAGVLALIVVCTSSVGNSIKIARKVDWSILLFFIGLFMLMGGVVESGLIDMISETLGFDGGSVWSVSVFSAVLSNLVSNVPAVALIGNMMTTDGMMWIALAASATLAGNATLLGSAANMIVAEGSERYGVKVNFWKFMLVGIPVSVVTIIISVLMIGLMM